MNRKQKKELRQRQSRPAHGHRRVTPHGIVTDSGERVFFLIQPDNLSVLSRRSSRPRPLPDHASQHPALAGDSGAGLP